MDFVFHQKVLFKHCDPAGIVFYPRYFEMLNDAVEALFDAIGHPFEKLLLNGGLPTAQIACTFSAPSFHGNQLAFYLRPTRIGRSALDLQFTALAGSDVRLKAASTLVYVGKDGGPKRWEKDALESLTPYLGDVQ